MKQSKYLALQILDSYILGALIFFLAILLAGLMAGVAWLLVNAVGIPEAQGKAISLLVLAFCASVLSIKLVDPILTLRDVNHAAKDDEA